MRIKPDPETTAFGISIGIGKKVFHVVALNAAGAVIQRAKFLRDTSLSFFDAAPKVPIGMEACPGSQGLARRLAATGHDARIIPARFVKPCVKSNKTDNALHPGSDARAGRSASPASHPRPPPRVADGADEPSARLLHRIRTGDAEAAGRSAR
ncbi:MAG: transposase [Rubellimicrobium sp.]|nr:transposase [Rubellimicrobium sp.]